QRAARRSSGEGSRPRAAAPGCPSRSRRSLDATASRRARRCCCACSTCATRRCPRCTRRSSRRGKGGRRGSRGTRRALSQRSSSTRPGRALPELARPLHGRRAGVVRGRAGYQRLHLRRLLWGSQGPLGPHRAHPTHRTVDRLRRRGHRLLGGKQRRRRGPTRASGPRPRPCCRHGAALRRRRDARGAAGRRRAALRLRRFFFDAHPRLAAGSCPRAADGAVSQPTVWRWVNKTVQRRAGYGSR
ncbi:hypothetical protein EMIHUDRAFT_438526, partial [Emiliania huxleyi CCMP1516]|uniref:Uncharacterized protein n=2 Tax=Emiliania huxleyi TaxID=2903 RepID=A0A0D3I854_EMIH1